MRRKYVIIRLFFIFLGYMSVGLGVAGLILTIFGHGSVFTAFAMIIGMGMTILCWCGESHYQEKVNKLDYDEKV